MITPQEFLKLIKDDPSANYKIGTVGTVNGNKAKIIFDGEQVQSGKEYLGVGYSPNTGDRVLLVNVSGTYLIIGAIGSGGGSGGGDIEIINNLTSTATDKALSANMGRELFQSVSNGKSLIAGAITDKGVITSPSDSFSVMAGNIGEIASGSLWATGESTSSYVISGLSFTPSYVYVFQSGSQEFRKIRTIAVEEPSLAYAISTSGDFIQNSHITINSNGFEMNDRISRPYKWVAIE